MVTQINKQHSFGLGEAVALLGLSVVARIFLSFPNRLVELGGPAAWMTPLGGLIAAMGAVYLLYSLLKLRPGKTLMEISEEAFGPYFGLAFNIVFAVLLLELFGAIFIREFSEVILISTMYFAPINLVALAFLGVGLLGAYLGIEALARTARIVYIYVLLGLLVLIFALIPFWDFHNIVPVLGNGPKEVFLLGTLSSAGIMEIVIAGIMVRSMSDTKSIAKVCTVVVLTGFGFLSLMLLTLCLTYNWPVSEEFTVPFITLARTIYLGRFAQRMEAIFILILGIVAAIKISLLLYGAAVALAQTLKLPDYRPLIWPLGLAMFIISRLPPDFTTVLIVEHTYMRSWVLIPNYILPILAIVILWLRKRRGTDG